MSTGTVRGEGDKTVPAHVSSDSLTAPAKRSPTDSADQKNGVSKPLAKKSKKSDAGATTDKASKQDSITVSQSSLAAAISTKKAKKDTLPPREPKTKKPSSKIDNIMAMLMGK